jgi:hypothetical protein
VKKFHLFTWDDTTEASAYALYDASFATLAEAQNWHEDHRPSFHGEILMAAEDGTLHLIYTYAPGHWKAVKV